MFHLPPLIFGFHFLVGFLMNAVLYIALKYYGGYTRNLELGKAAGPVPRYRRWKPVEEELR